MEDSQEKYDAFISYSHLDREYAKVIQRSLETLGLPFYKKWKNDIKLFRDQRKVPLTDDLTQEIKKGLKNSRCLIVIASKHSAGSKWVKEEILEWHRLNKDKEGYITKFNFIQVDDVIKWDATKKNFDLVTTALPNFDQALFKSEPAWSNIKNYCKDNKIDTSNDNYEWEIARVKGWLLGMNPDKIIDDVSNSKKLFRFALIFGMVIFGLLATVAFIQKQAADKATALAEERRKEAEDNLTDFKIEEFERNIRNGTIYFDAQVYCLAKQVLMKADSTSNDPKYSMHEKIQSSKASLKEMLVTSQEKCKN